MANRQFDIDTCAWIIVEDDALLRDFELWKKTRKSGRPKITQALKAVLAEYGLSVADIEDVYKALRSITNIEDVQDSTPELATVQHMARIDETKKEKPVELVESSTQAQAGMWKKITKGTMGGTDSRYRLGDAVSHLYAIRWERTGSYGAGNRGVGNLYVAFATGGRVSRNSIPLYKYRPVSYDEYYELWKRTPSPGSWMWRNMQSRNPNYEGQISKTIINRNS